MLRNRLDRGFEEFAAARMSSLLRTAVFLTGDRSKAEDLLQNALLRTARRWRTVRDQPDAYVRKVLVNLARDEWRSSRRRPVEVELADDQPAVLMRDLSADLGEREELLAALRLLPARQRTAVTLRFWEGLSITETAALMDCTEGTVKSTTSRGLAHLATILQSETT
jgi:RNA polymerase sigma-70 factor (sigma-E family)